MKSITRLIPLLIIGFEVNAQGFGELVTTADGSAVYFSTPARQKGTGQRFGSKVFKWSAGGGVQLVAESGPAGNEVCGEPDYCEAMQPRVSLDGSVVAYTEWRRVPGCRGCKPDEPYRGTVLREGKTIRLEGRLLLSPNGRYAVTSTAAAQLGRYHTVTDLSTGVSTAVAGEIKIAPQQVTNEGASLSTALQVVFLTDRLGGTRLLLTTHGFREAIVDPTGTTVAYVKGFDPDGPALLVALDVKTGRETQLADGFNIRNAAFSADGSTVYFFRNPGGSQPDQLYAAGVTGGSLRPMMQWTDRVSTVTYAGDGKVGYLGGTRVRRIDLASGSSTDVIPTTPFVTAAYNAFPPAIEVAAAGSVVDLLGGEGATSLTFCGRAVATQTVRQFFLRFQVPWDLPDGTCFAVPGSDSPFESSLRLDVRQYAPAFLWPRPGPPFVFHLNADGSGRMVSQALPAHPGELVVGYLTGLGPVDENGLVAGGFGCTVDGVAAEVRYAGTSPYAGFYQLNVVIPDVQRLQPLMFCGWEGERGRASADLWVAR